MAKKNGININDLSTWPIIMTLFVAIVIAAIILYMVKTFFIDELTDRINRKNTEIIQQENQYKRDKQIVAILPKIRADVKKLQTMQENLKTFLPTKVSMPSLIDNVYVVGRNNGIIFDKLVPGEYIEKKYYAIKPISLRAEIGFESMAAFIEEVTTLERIMNVDSVSFTVSDNDTSHRNANVPLLMTAQLRTYVFKDILPDKE